MNLELALSVSALVASVAAVVVTVVRRKASLYAELRDENEALRLKADALKSEVERLQSIEKALRSKLTAERLDEHATRAVAYAEQLGGTPAEKLRHAMDASIRFDVETNGVQDWTPAQHRIAIEAALHRLAK